MDKRISDAAFHAVRSFIDNAGYGRFVSDEHCRELSDVAAVAANSELELIKQEAAKPVDPKQPLSP